MRPTAIALAFWAACAGSVAAAQANASPSWDDTFPTAEAPERVVFEARYLDEHGASHILQVWREGARRLRRLTDDWLDLVVEADGRGEYAYRLVDRTNRVLVRADRTSLYRIGRFSDWRGLAHVLDVPRRTFTVTKLPFEAQAASTRDCEWHQLDVAGGVTPTRCVCWSSHWGIPLEIKVQRSEVWEAKFEILDVRTFESGEADFSARAEGLVELDVTDGGEISD